jgi:uncharacterized protein YdaL
LNYVGPVPEDSSAWVSQRIQAANAEFVNAGLPSPTIFEFPHYSASVPAYQTVATTFQTRWERCLYFGGLLNGGPILYSRIFGQFFPYVVTDLYGTKVLPENLGNIEPTPWFIYPVRLPADIINAASKNLVVRDGFASFFFHPYLDISYLQQTVDGIRSLGYTFVSPAGL